MRSTYSTNFPTTRGGLPAGFRRRDSGSGYDAFVTKMIRRAPLVYSTYLGGSGTDGANGIAVDGAGNAYVTGYTYSTNFPTTPGAFQTTTAVRLPTAS